MNARGDQVNTAALIANLQSAMSDYAGPFKTRESLQQALTVIAELENKIGAAPPGAPDVFDPSRVDWFDLRNMLLIGRAVVESALSRKESRGAHQREDHPGLMEEWTLNQFVEMDGETLSVVQGPAASDLESPI